MSEIIVFDTETTGIPIWKSPSGGDDQPHIVQLAAALVNTETQKVGETFDYIIRPDGWEISEEMTAIHGISHEQAMDEGEPEDVILDLFLSFWNNRKRVAYNTTFDNRIIRIGTKRYFDEDVSANWKAGEYECAMIGSRCIMGGKQPKLEEAYRYFFGEEMEDAHNAAADVAATIRVYFAMKALQKISETDAT